MKKACKKFAVVAIWLAQAALIAGLSVCGATSVWSYALTIAGFFVCYALSSFFHEAGHFLSGKIKGFKTVVFSFWIFTLDLTAKKPFKIGRTGYAGETGMIPTRGENLVGGYGAATCGGIAGSAFSLFLLVSLYLFVPIAAVKSVFAAFPASVALLLINAIPNLVDGNDGGILLSLMKKENAERAEKYLQTVKRLYEGKSFSEMPEGLFTIDNIEFYLMRKAELFEISEIKFAADEMAKREDIDENGRKLLAIAYLLIGENQKAEEFGGCALGDEAIDMTANCFFAKARGDEKYLKVALPTAKKVAGDCYLKGEGKFFKRLLERL